jgi:hypothetical protein
MTYKIEDGIPVPDKGGLTATLRKLKVGQSFTAPLSAQRGSLYTTAKWLGIKVISKKCDGLIRIWRVE